MYTINVKKPEGNRQVEGGPGRMPWDEGAAALGVAGREGGRGSRSERGEEEEEEGRERGGGAGREDSETLALRH